MKVSVIIPTYNRLSTLPRAIDSVRQQTWKDWDLWVVDDGSTDGTEDDIKTRYPDLLESQRLNLITTSRGGVSRARNLALQESDGPWLAFLDSDDEWLPDKLEKQLALAARSPSYPLIHGEEIWVRNGVRVNPMKKHEKSGGRIFDRCLPLCCISPSTALIRRAVFEEVGPFREDFPVCEDYELWLRICARYEVGFVEDPVILKYGGHEDQLSRQHRAMDFWRVLALEPFLASSVLSRRERRCVAEVICDKARILLQGYRKHQNMADHDRIEAIQTRAYHSMTPENPTTFSAPSP